VRQDTSTAPVIVSGHRRKQRDARRGSRFLWASPSSGSGLRVFFFFFCFFIGSVVFAGGGNLFWRFAAFNSSLTFSIFLSQLFSATASLKFVFSLRFVRAVEIVLCLVILVGPEVMPSRVENAHAPLRGGHQRTFGQGSFLRG